MYLTSYFHFQNLPADLSVPFTQQSDLLSDKERRASETGQPVCVCVLVGVDRIRK